MLISTCIVLIGEFFPKMPNAYVTLLTSDNYLPGALVVAQSLRTTQTIQDVVILVTKQVSPDVVEILNRHYNQVITVELLRSRQFDNLKLLGRPDLDVTFTKLHCFNPELMKSLVGTRYEKIVFLDADTLVLSSVETLFDYVGGETVFAAASDVGWPDTFNSGVFVAQPSKELYNGLLETALLKGSFDGGDQGLLNEYFHDWSLSGIKNQKTARLPFIFNVTPSASYAYLPAYEKFKNDIKVIMLIDYPFHWKFEAMEMESRFK